MNKILSFLILSILYVNHVNCEFEKRVYFDTILSNENAFKFFNPDFEKYLQVFDLILNGKDKNITKECENNLRTIKQSLIKKEEWAMKCKFFR